MKTFTKAIALLLSMLMILAVAPISVFAEETTTENTQTETEPVASWYSSYGMHRGDGSLEEAVTSVPAGGRISLLKDITDFDAALTIAHDVTIDGEGYTITRSETYTGTMFVVENATSLTLTNITVNGNSENCVDSADSIITVTSGDVTLDSGAVLTANAADASNGAAIKVGTEEAATAAACSVVMNEGAEISDCTGSIGGAVYLANKATMTINGGVIKNCEASRGGAVAATTASSAVTMLGGEISGCTATYEGSAIYAGNGKVTVSAGNISGNTNESNLGAVYVSSVATVTAGGDAYIYDNDGINQGSNIYLDTDVVLTVEPAFTQNSKIGVSTPDNYKLGDQVDMSFLNYSGDIVGYLFNDADGTTFYTIDGVVTLIETITITFDPGNGVCEYTSKVYPVGMEFGTLPAVEEREGFEFLGWYTVGGDLVTEESLVTFDSDITLSAQWENLNALDTNPFAMIGRFFERIGEMLRMVFEFLENMFTGSGNDELENLK